MTPNGQLVASGSDDTTVRVWSISTQELLYVLKGHSKAVQHLVVSPDGYSLLSGDSGGTLCLWTIREGRLQRILADKIPAGVRALAASPDGRLVAIGSNDPSVRVWNPITEVIHVLTGHSGIVVAALFTPDSARLATAGEDGTICLWSMPEGQLIQRLRGHSLWVASLAISPDGKLLASASNDSIRLWTLPDGELQWLEKCADGGGFPVAIGPQGNILVGGKRDGTIQVWGLPDGRALATLESHTLIKNSIGSEVLAISPDGLRLVSGDVKGEICICDLPYGKTSRRFDAHADLVTALTITPDSRTLISASWDGSVRLWELSPR